MFPEIEQRRYFIGFVNRDGRGNGDYPVSFAPVLSMANGFAEYPELHEVTFTQWYVFKWENETEDRPFPAKVPSELYFWQYLANWNEQ